MDGKVVNSFKINKAKFENFETCEHNIVVPDPLQHILDTSSQTSIFVTPQPKGHHLPSSNVSITF